MHFLLIVKNGPNTETVSTMLGCTIVVFPVRNFSRLVIGYNVLLMRNDPLLISRPSVIGTCCFGMCITLLAVDFAVWCGQRRFWSTPRCGLGLFWNQSPKTFAFKTICVGVDQGLQWQMTAGLCNTLQHHWNCSKQQHQWQMCRWHRQVLQNQHRVDHDVILDWLIR